MDEIIGLFPTPIQIARGAIPTDLVAKLIDHFQTSQSGPNVRTALLSHTPMQNPRGNDTFVETGKHILPRLREYGFTLMGERMAWAIKEIWINRMEKGGAQKMHNHANSFVSGVIYLTDTGNTAPTVFYRNVGSDTFVMSNENKRCEIGPYNAPVYQIPPMHPGDMVLFPSYVMHEVPPNKGRARMTAAFNALPERLDSWGYVLKFK